MLDTTISIRPMYVMAMALSSIYERMILDCFHPMWGGGGTCKNFDRDAHVIFGGFETYENIIFWVSLNWRHLFVVEKIAVIFLGPLKICVIFLGYQFFGLTTKQMLPPLVVRKS